MIIPCICYEAKEKKKRTDKLVKLVKDWESVSKYISSEDGLQYKIFSLAVFYVNFLILKCFALPVCLYGFPQHLQVNVSTRQEQITSPVPSPVAALISGLNSQLY